MQIIFKPKVKVKEDVITNYGRFAPSSFRAKSFRPNSKSFPPNSKSFRPDQNKTSTAETLFTPQVRPWEDFKYRDRQTIDQRTLFDFAAIARFHSL